MNAAAELIRPADSAFVSTPCPAHPAPAFASPLFDQASDYAAKGNAYHAAVIAAYERKGYLLGTLSDADAAEITRGFARDVHPATTANKLLIARFIAPRATDLDQLCDQVRREWQAHEARAAAAKARFDAMLKAQQDAEIAGWIDADRAREAARDATIHEARDAALAAIAPTRKELQQSACRLLDRMIECGATP